MQRLTR